jgi:DNA-binding NarL/FixJ family response regulator
LITTSLSRVLFVDDEPSVLSALRRLLFPQRYRWAMTFAASGRAALEAMLDEPFDVVVTDMLMPDMDGAALLHEVHQLYPQTALLVLSGYSDASATLSASQLARQILRKPCEPAALIEAISSALRVGELEC